MSLREPSESTMGTRLASAKVLHTSSMVWEVEMGTKGFRPDRSANRAGNERPSHNKKTTTHPLLPKGRQGTTATPNWQHLGSLWSKIQAARQLRRPALRPKARTDASTGQCSPRTRTCHSQSPRVRRAGRSRQRPATGRGVSPIGRAVITKAHMQFTTRDFLARVCTANQEHSHKEQQYSCLRGSAHTPTLGQEENNKERTPTQHDMDMMHWSEKCARDSIQTAESQLGTHSFTPFLCTNLQLTTQTSECVFKEYTLR